MLVCARELTGNNNSKATRVILEHLCSLCLFATATMIELVNLSLDFRRKTDAVQLVRVLQPFHDIAYFTDFANLR